MSVKRDISIRVRSGSDRSHIIRYGLVVYDSNHGLYLSKEEKWTRTYTTDYLFKTREQAIAFLSEYFKKHPEEFAEYAAKRILKGEHL